MPYDQNMNYRLHLRLLCWVTGTKPETGTQMETKCNCKITYTAISIRSDTRPNTLTDIDISVSTSFSEFPETVNISSSIENYELNRRSLITFRQGNSVKSRRSVTCLNWSTVASDLILYDFTRF